VTSGDGRVALVSGTRAFWYGYEFTPAVVRADLMAGHTLR
jgi:hypothetical protein